MNAGNINLSGNVNATGGSGILTNSLTGSTDVINYGNVSGNNVGISTRTSGMGLLNIVVGNAATITGTTSHGIVAISTLGAVKVTTLSGVTINSDDQLAFSRKTRAHRCHRVCCDWKQQLDFDLDVLRDDQCGHPRHFGWLSDERRPRRQRYPIRPTRWSMATSISTTMPISPRGTGVGIIAYNYGVGNIAVSTAGTITATAAGTTIPGTTQTQYGVSAFNYGSGSTTVTTGPGSSITSGGAGLNVGNQASAVAAVAASTVTVVALGIDPFRPKHEQFGQRPCGHPGRFQPQECRRVQRKCFR